MTAPALHLEPARPTPSPAYAFAVGLRDGYTSRWATAPTRAAILLAHPELHGWETLWRLHREGFMLARMLA